MAVQFPSTYTITDAKGKTITIKRPDDRPAIGAFFGRAVNDKRTGRLHRGQDVGGRNDKGWALLAPYNDTEIVLAPGGSGGSIAFKCPPSLMFPKGCIVWMMHCQNVNVKTNDRVARGHKLGEIGDENGKYTPHLHIEIWNATSIGDASETWRSNNQYAYGPRKRWGIWEMHPQCLLRILGGDGTSNLIHGVSGYPSADNYPSEPTKFWTLKEYVDGVLHLLATCDDPYLYYYNANQRYKIRKSHYIQDMPQNMFSIYFGADWYDSLIAEQYRNMDKYVYETMDKLYQGLHRIGYIGYSTPMPKYDEKNDCLMEYMVAPGFYLHDPPAFNTIIVRPEDQIQANTGSIPVTALKYKCRAGDLEWSAIYSPAVATDEHLATDDFPYSSADYKEAIYGMNRQVKDMSYYYGQYLERADQSVDGYLYDDIGWVEVKLSQVHGTTEEAARPGTRVYGRLCDLDRILGSYNHDTMNITLNEFKPDYVVGLPAIVRWGEVDRCYWGMIDSITYVLDPSRGGVQTSIGLRMVINVEMSPYPDELYYGTPFKRMGINPHSKIDETIHNTLSSYYKTHFYPGEYKGEVYDDKQDVILRAHQKDDDDYEGTIGIKTEIDALLPWQTHRSICTLRQYLKMYKHQNIAALEKYTDISEIKNFTTTSAGSNDAVPLRTIESNANSKLDIKNISDIYIRERYDRAKKFSDLLLDNRVLYYVDRETGVMRTVGANTPEDVANKVDIADYDWRTMRIPAGQEVLYRDTLRKDKRPSGRQHDWPLLRWRINHLLSFGEKAYKSVTGDDAAELNRIIKYMNW